MKTKYYDITVSLGLEAITYPGDPSFLRSELGSLEEGDLFEVSLLAMSAHCGTHLDAPRHMFIEGKSIDQYEPAEFIFPVWVLEAEEERAVGVKALEEADLQAGDAVLFKTRNSSSGISRKASYEKDYVYLSEPAVQFCADKELGLVGIDYISVDPYEETDFPAHRILLQKGILILEGITLDHVPPGKYTLICLPLKIKGGEAAPCRAILMAE